MKNSQETNFGSGFFAGLITGGALASGVAYLFLTKQGRKLTKTIVKLAEEYGEKGERFLEKQKVEEKVIEVVDKIKSKLNSPKKSIDIEK
jgi:gas vesicle protein